MQFNTNPEYSMSIEEITYRDEHFSLRLRPLEEQDAKVIHEAVLCSLENFLAFMDWAHLTQSVNGQLERIRKSKEDFSKGTEYNFSVFDDNTREFLASGTLSFSTVPNKNAWAIGYWTSIKHCNKGIATLITKILTVFAFDFLKSDCVKIGCNKANKKSARVIEKCGFKPEGEVRNYFSEPSLKMIENGYHPDRTFLQYALIPEDLKSLSWFNEIKAKITIKTP